MLNKNSPASHQPLDLLERLGEIIEMGQRVVKGTTYWRRALHRKNEKQEDEYSQFPTPRLTVFCLAS